MFFCELEPHDLNASETPPAAVVEFASFCPLLSIKLPAYPSLNNLLVACITRKSSLCSWFYVRSYAEGSGVIHLAAGIV